MSAVRVTRVVCGVSVLAAAAASVFAAASCFSETAPFSIDGAGDGATSDGGDATTGDGSTKARWCATQRRDALCEDFDQPPLNPALTLQATGTGSLEKVVPFDGAPSPPNVAAFHVQSNTFQAQAILTLPTSAATQGVTVGCKIELHAWDAGAYATTIAAIAVHSGTAVQLYSVNVDSDGSAVLLVADIANDASGSTTRPLSQPLAFDRFTTVSIGLARAAADGKLTVQVVVDGSGAATLENVAAGFGDAVGGGCGLARTNPAAVPSQQDAIVDDVVLFAD